MSALVIDAHPNPASLTAALASAYADGHGDARLLALRDLDFDVHMRFGYTQRMPIEPDLADARQAIRDADHVVIATPVWWRSTPALLKGFLDRALLPQQDYRYRGMAPRGCSPAAPAASSPRAIPRRGSPPCCPTRGSTSCAAARSGSSASSACGCGGSARCARPAPSSAPRGSRSSPPTAPAMRLAAPATLAGPLRSRSTERARRAAPAPVDRAPSGTDAWNAHAGMRIRSASSPSLARSPPPAPQAAAVEAPQRIPVAARPRRGAPHAAARGMRSGGSASEQTAPPPGRSSS